MVSMVLDKNGVVLSVGDVVVSRYADLVYRGTITKVYRSGDIKVYYDDETVKTKHVIREIVGSSEGFVKE